MILGDLSADETAGYLRNGGISLRTGPFNLRIRSDVPGLVTGLRTLYEDYPLADRSDFCDYAVDILRARGIRRWIRPQIRFLFDHQRVNEPMPADHAMPLVEWALNWCIGIHSHQFVVLHAGAIERDGLTAVLPAAPGSGKSTLCAGLVSRGWRLLSDELALLSVDSGQFHALARPISLKNASIDLMRDYAPKAVFSAKTHATAKGTVAHMRAPREDILRSDEPARPGWVIFPRWGAGQAASLTPRAKADSMLELSRHTMNSGVAGREGFQVLADLVRDSDCYDFCYSQLDDAVRIFDDLALKRRT